MNETIPESPAYDVEVITQPQAVDKPKSAPMAIAPRTATDMRVVEVSEALAPAYARASTLELTDEEVAALTAPFPDSSVDIRPHDGLIFLSHINISDRLTKVFKPGKWSLVLRRHWLEQNIVYGEYILLIKGCYVGESIGGHPYQPNNPKVNYSDTLESTAAEALRRICGKRLSCGSQVWHKDYADAWVAKNAVQRAGKWYKQIQGTPQNAPPASANAVPSVPKPQPVPLTTEQRKARLITALEPLRPEALKVLVEEGVLMEGEDLADISLTTIERMSPNQMLALIQTVKQRRADADQIPDAEVVEPERPWESARLPFTSPKNPAAKKGMTLKELFANPETSKWVWGLVQNFKAEPRTAANGKVYQPSEDDIAFAFACEQWREEHQDAHD